MTLSSAQVDCLTTLSNDTITLTGFDSNCWNPNTITLTSSMPGGCYTYASSSGSTYTTGVSGISTIDISSIWNRQDFVDCMPDLKRIEEMCKEYPGLKIAFEKFKTTYFLVKDHYDTPEDQRPRP